MKNEQVSQKKVNLYASEAHESSEKHVSGSAQYIDDIPLPEGGVHAYIGFADCAHGIITSLDLSLLFIFRSSPCFSHLPSIAQ